jgi:hypothetical protein
MLYHISAYGGSLIVDACVIQASGLWRADKGTMYGKGLYFTESSTKARLWGGGWAGETQRKQVWSCRELQYSTVHALRKDFGNAEAIELESICICSQILLSIIPWNAFVYFGLLLFPSAFGLLITHSHGMGLTDGSPAVS